MSPPPRKGRRSSPPFSFLCPRKLAPAAQRGTAAPQACPVILTAEVVEAGEIHDLSPKSHGGEGPGGPSGSGKGRPHSDQAARRGQRPRQPLPACAAPSGRVGHRRAALPSAALAVGLASLARKCLGIPRTSVEMPLYGSQP